MCLTYSFTTARATLCTITWGAICCRSPSRFLFVVERLNCALCVKNSSLNSANIPENRKRRVAPEERGWMPLTCRQCRSTYSAEIRSKMSQHDRIVKTFLIGNYRKIIGATILNAREIWTNITYVGIRYQPYRMLEWIKTYVNARSGFFFSSIWWPFQTLAIAALYNFQSKKSNLPFHHCSKSLFCIYLHVCLFF